MRVLLIICIVIFPRIQSYGQDVIKMEKSGGVYLIPLQGGKTAQTDHPIPD
jgi:hypothetical protein